MHTHTYINIYLALRHHSRSQVAAALRGEKRRAETEAADGKPRAKCKAKVGGEGLVVITCQYNNFMAEELNNYDLSCFFTRGFSFVCSGACAAGCWHPNS